MEDNEKPNDEAEEFLKDGDWVEPYEAEIDGKECVAARFGPDFSRNILELTQKAGCENPCHTLVNAIRMFEWLNSQVGKGYVKRTKDGYKMMLVNLKNKSEYNEFLLNLPGPEYHD